MKTSEVWKNYWKSENLKECKFFTNLRPYQIPFYSILKKIIKENNYRSILSSGAGQDIISFNLQKEFKNRLKITLLDISEDVLDWNKRLFFKHHLKAQFIKADIFQTPFEPNSFDVVFNTGVLEHFKREEQIKIVKETLRVLKSSGYFITANPSANGKLYNLGMKIAKKKGIWRFGNETPIKSLFFLSKEISGIKSIREINKDFLTQLSFLTYINPMFKFIIFPLELISKLPFLTQVYDTLFSRVFGTYLIISIIKKL